MILSRQIKIFFSAVSFTLFILVGIFLLRERDVSVPTSLEMRMVRVGNTVFRAEMARTSEEKSLGLGKRPDLCSDCAMLFVFDRPGQYSFWMKDMLFDLDFLWIADGRVVSVSRNVATTDTEILTPSVPVDSVLEIGAGQVERFGIREGDSVEVR